MEKKAMRCFNIKIFPFCLLWNQKPEASAQYFIICHHVHKKVRRGLSRYENVYRPKRSRCDSLCCWYFVRSRTSALIIAYFLVQQLNNCFMRGCVNPEQLLQRIFIDICEEIDYGKCVLLQQKQAKKGVPIKHIIDIVNIAFCYFL